MDVNFFRGNVFSDERGKLLAFNDFDMSPVKRFYIIEHFDTKVIRAWQGHKFEQKWFFATKGKFKVLLTSLEDWENTSSPVTVQEYILDANDDQILNVPRRIITGFRALEENSSITVFSDKTLEESSQDDYRFDRDLWHKWD